jgi:DNA-binding transcriptional MocR family regulator
VAAPAPVIARLTLAKELADLTTGAMPQLALADLLAAGYDDHLAAVRRAYAERRAAMLAGLAALHDHLVAAPGPPGGFYLWCRLVAGPRARLLAASAARAGVALLAGEVFYPRTLGTPAEGADRVRLSYAGHTPATIGEGLRRLRPVLEALPATAAAMPARGLRPVV